MESLDRIEEYVHTQFQANHIIGGSYAIVSEGKVVAAKGIGVSDQETKAKVTPETIYSIASVTKPFTAAAILQLVEEGTFKLDAPVKDYIPWFSYKNKSQSLQVTIRHLLTHSAGINRFEGDGAIFEDEKKNRDSLEESIKSLRTVPMSFKPGTKAEYCNSCYNVLGLMIEKESGVDYEKYMEKKLFSPLGMANTTFNPANATNVASEYNWVFGLKHKSSYNNVVFGESQNPEGGIYSNVLDLSKFLSAMLGESPLTLLSRETLDFSQAEGVLSEYGDSKYTVSGFEVGKINGTKVLYKSGDGIGSTAVVMMIPEKKIGITLLVGDSVPEFGDPLMRGIAQILLGESPQDVHVGITFWKLAGLISFGITIISLVLVLFFVKSLLSRRKPKKKWPLLIRSFIFSIIALPSWYLIIAVHPSQIGFYGYPYDLAIGLISIIVASTLLAVYSIILLFVNKK